MRRNDRRIYAVTHPILWRVVRLLSRRRLIRLPVMGTVVSDSALAREALADGARFTKTGNHGSTELFTRVFGPNMLMNSDGTEHRDLRRTIAPLFTPAAARTLCEARTQPYVDDARARLERGEAVDMARLAMLVSGISTCTISGFRLTGTELEARALRTHDAAAELARKVAAVSWRASDRMVRSARLLVDEMTDGIDGAWHDRDPETVPGLLAAAGSSLEHARGVVGTLLVAGTDTTSSAIARMVAQLADSRQLEQLSADASNDRIDSAVSESLRFSAPVPMLTRSAEAEQRLGDRTVPADSQLVVLVTNCLRDELAIDDPNEFIVGRTLPRHVNRLWFGSGQHFCPGQAIARELMTTIARMLASLDAPLRVVSRKPARRVLLPTYARLEMELCR